MSYEWSDLCYHCVSWESGGKLTYKLSLCNAPVFNHIFLISENCECLRCYCLGKAYYWWSYFWSETVEFLWTLLEDSNFWGHTTGGFDKIACKSYFWLSHSLPSERKWHKKRLNFNCPYYQQFDCMNLHFPMKWSHKYLCQDILSRHHNGGDSRAIWNVGKLAHWIINQEWKQILEYLS